MPERVAELARQAHGGVRLEVTVVAHRTQTPSKNVAECVGELGRSRRRRLSPLRPVVQRVAARCGDRDVDGRPGLTQRTGLGVDGERRLVAEQVADHGRQHERRVEGASSGTLSTASAAVKARSPSEAITIGAALWARKIATSLATSSAVDPTRPAAHTRIIGSDDRSMCFLSSVRVAGDGLVAELGQLDPQLASRDLVRRRCPRSPSSGGSGRTSAPRRRWPVGCSRRLLQPGRAGRAARASSSCSLGRRRRGARPAPRRRWRGRAADRPRPGRRRPWSTRRSSPRRARRRCRARRRTCR